LSYEIKLQHFEGPFELILYFIERNELDIYDIPIAEITADFLTYIKKAKELNIELASDFILVAATLVRIKAKMLLPRKDIDEETGEEIDPRQELVDKLLEYRRFKEVCKTLAELEENRLHSFGRGNFRADVGIINNSFTNEFELESLDLFKLFKAFQKVMDKFELDQKRLHTVVKYDYTIKEEKELLLKVANSSKDKIWNFEKLFEECQDRIHCIFRFLAMLEMVQEQLLKLKLGDGINSFHLTSVIYEPA